MKHLRLFEEFEEPYYFGNEEPNSIDDILRGGQDYIVPKYLYHLTPANNIEDVMKNGLKVETSKQHYFTPGVYLTNSIYVAETYKYLSDEFVENWYIIQIPFGNLNEEFMKPDDYELFDLLEDEWSEVLKYLRIPHPYNIGTNKKMVWDSMTYEQSLFICNQMLYTKNITPDKFSRVFTKDEIEAGINKLDLG